MSPSTPAGACTCHAVVLPTSPRARPRKASLPGYWPPTPSAPWPSAGRWSPSACSSSRGALVFGSGLAVVPLLRDGVVAQHHWLTQARFLDAVAMGLITPGRSSSPPPHRLPRRRRHRRTHRHRRHLYPICLGVAVHGRWFIRHRDNPRLKAFGTGATAAIALLALLWRFKLSEPYIVGAAGALGLLLH